MNLEVIRYEWYPLGKTSKSAICIVAVVLLFTGDLGPVEADFILV